MARALALGAQAAGIARPLLTAYVEGGAAAVERLLDRTERQLRTVMLLTGSKDLDALRDEPRILGSALSRWLG